MRTMLGLGLVLALHAIGLGQEGAQGVRQDAAQGAAQGVEESTGRAYRIESGGGPLTLSEELAEAAAAWNRIDEGLVLVESADADAVIAFDDPEAMGPDLVSLTIVSEDSQELQIRLNPELYRDYPAALLHELGLLLGLPAGGQGVMSPLLAEGDPGVPDETDLAALDARRGRTLGDLDGDGAVGIADLAELGRAFGRSGVNLPADLNGDGVVDGEDVEAMRSLYRFTAPAPEEAQPNADEAAGAPGGAGASDAGDTGGEVD